MNDKELRELDAWLAEHVMGWVPVRGDWWPEAVNPGKFNCDSKEADGWAHPYEDGGIAMPDGKTYCSRRNYEWQPATDSAAAMEVFKACVKKAAPRGVYCEFNAGYNNFSFGLEGMESREATAETEELAICLFAKKLFSAE